MYTCYLLVCLVPTRGSNWYRSIGGIGTIFGIGIADTLTPDTSIPAFWSILRPKIDQFGRALGPTIPIFTMQG